MKFPPLAATISWWWAVVALADVALLLLILRRAAGARARQKTWAVPPLLAGLLSATLLLLSLTPTCREQVAVPAASEVALLLDDSCSMALSASEQRSATSRYDEARAALMALYASFAARALGPDSEDAKAGNDDSLARVRFASLSGALADEPAQQLSDSACRHETDLIGALTRLAAHSERPIRAAVVASDGTDTSSRTLTMEQRAQAQSLGFPVHTLAVGRPPKDVRIVAVRHPEFAFVKAEVPIEVVVGQSLRQRRSVEVSLWRANTRIAREQVMLDGDTERTLLFSPRFEQVGTELLLATIEPVADEVTYANNEQAFAVRILRDKTRVLHVLGTPSFDGRFVREALRASRNVDLVSFYILRTPNNEMVVQDSELSLIQFPVARLFTSELKNFDVVVLQNFDPRLFHMAPYLAGLSRAVKDGLGLIMLGGPHSFAEGGYHLSPLADIMPLTMLPAAGQQQLGVVALASGAEGHAVLQNVWPPQGTSMREQWAQLAPVTTAPSGEPRPGAAILLNTQAAAGGQPSRPASAGGEPFRARPLLAVRSVERGRTIMLMTDESWRWSFAAGREGEPFAQSVLPRLWQNMLAYLVHEDDDDGLTSALADNEAVAGRPLTLTARLHAQNFAAAASVPIDLTAQWLPSPLSLPSQGASAPDQAAPTALLTPRQNPSAAPISLRATTNEAGEAQFVVPLAAPGRLRLTLATVLESRALQQQVQVAVVAGPEQRLVAPQPTWLAALSEATGGRVLNPKTKSSLDADALSAPAKVAWLLRPVWPRAWLVCTLVAALLAYFALGGRRPEV